MKHLLVYLFIATSSTLFAQFSVGHRTITFNDPSRTGGFGSGGGAGRQIQTEIYYPAATAGNNVAIASGTFPVIVFGHGFAMSWDAYQNIWEHYAALGYILAFARTEGSLIPSPSHSDFGLDLKLIGEKMTSENANSASPFFQSMNGNTAIMGHSMGGGTTILAAANNPNIKAIVGLAPAETNPSAIAAAPNVSVPAIIFSGSSDGVTPPADHHIPIYNGLISTCKTFVSVVGGGHCYYANTNFNCDFGETTSSTGISITRAQQQARTFSLLDPWLEYMLKDNCDAYTQFSNVQDDSPSTLAVQTTCALNVSPVISLAIADLVTTEVGLTYQWFQNGVAIAGATSSILSAPGSGVYSVQATYSNGCSAMSAPFNLGNSGLDELSPAVYTLSPNPTTGHLTLQSTHSEAVQVTVRNADGQVVKSFVTSDEINITDLSNGLYILEINGSYHRIMKR
jgi:dienelactone hydrolase